MRITILSPSYQGSSSPFAGRDPECDPSRYAPEHSWVFLPVLKATAAAQIRAAVPTTDVFFNLCDGGWDEDRAGIDVARVLEALDVPFTGADARFFDPSRDAMKRVCRYYGIDTPAWAFASSVDAAVAATDRLRFPMILKHPASYSSIGMTRSSRVHTVDALASEAARFIDAYGSVLIEEFIEGREFTVLVSERIGDSRNGLPPLPDGYTPVECRFPPGETFKHFDLKWVDFGTIEWVPVFDEGLAESLNALTGRMFIGLNGRGYGRADFRMDRDGRLFALEMNPQPGVFYPDGQFGSADTILSVSSGGHRLFVRRLIDAALGHHVAARRSFEIRDNGSGGFGMVAARDIGAGEIIDPWECRPQRLVSREHAEAWTGLAGSWFRRYAWPVGDGVYAIWADDPMEWRPIDHSCDPNAWMTGLDLTARRTIARGEAITCDYGTFCDDLMEPFTCTCGGESCRGEIRGTDYLLPRIADYGSHVSPWVAFRRSLALV